MQNCLLHTKIENTKSLKDGHKSHHKMFDNAHMLRILKQNYGFAVNVTN